MNRIRTTLIVLSWALAGSVSLNAQDLPEKSFHATTAQIRSNGVTNPIMQKTGTSEAPQQDDTVKALQVVIQFLELRPDQEAVLGQLLQGRHQALAPLLQGIAQREEALKQLLESGGSPQQVGQLVIEIHILERQATLVQQDFLARWQSLLDSEQQQRLQAARVATALQPIVPAFGILRLL